MMMDARGRHESRSIAGTWLLVDVRSDGGYGLLFAPGFTFEPGSGLRSSLKSKRDREILLRALDSVVAAKIEGLDSNLEYNSLTWRIKVEAKRSPGSNEIVGLWAIYAPKDTELPPIPFELGGWEWDLKDLKSPNPIRIHWDDSQRRHYGDLDLFRESSPDYIQWLNERVSLVDSARLSALAAQWLKEKDFKTRHLVRYEISVPDDTEVVLPKTLIMSERLHKDPDGTFHFKGFSYPDPIKNPQVTAPTMSSLGMMNSFRRLFIEFGLVTYDAEAHRAAVISPSYVLLGLADAGQPIQSLVEEEDKAKLENAMKAARTNSIDEVVVVSVKWKLESGGTVPAEVRLNRINSIPESDRYLAIAVKPLP